MAMNQWSPQDSLANGNGFADPSMLSVEGNIFNQNGIHFQNHQQQQQIPTANPQQRSQTPQQFPYQVPSVVPSKRPRPAEDAVAASPGQPPATMNMSRSQTPQTAAFPSPFPYQQHLQPGGSNNATPSPTMQNQQFRPPSQAQRMQTVSPNPQFQQQQQQQQQQQPPMSMSPPPDANGRMTPQTQQFAMGGQMPNQLQGGQIGMGMQSQIAGQIQNQMGQQIAGNFPNGQIPPGFNPNFGNMAGMNQQPGFNAPVSLNPNLAAHQAQVNRDYQMKMQAAQQQHQQQQMANMRQGMPQPGMNRMMGAQQQNMGTPTRPPQINPQAQQTFLKQVQQFMFKSNRQFDPNPALHGRPVSLFQLFQLVIRSKGSKAVNQTNLWPKIATALNFPEPTAGPELKDVFERTLGPYEAAYWQNQQQKRMENAGVAGQQMSPTRSGPQTPQSATPQGQVGLIRAPSNSVPPEQMTPVQTNATIPAPNGWSTPQMETPSMKAQSLPSAHRKSISRPPEASPAPARQSPVAAPSETPKLTNGSSAVVQQQFAAHYDESCYLFGKAAQDSNYGGIAVEALWPIGHDISMVRPLVPDPHDMGVIDIRAINLSLQSGIRSEVRYALDVLIKMTGSAQLALELDQCEDLLDILIDCAEDQTEILQRDAPEISEIVDFPCYEDVVRNARLEFLSVQNLPEVGSPAHDADRAAEKLLAITTILRNLSFQYGAMNRNPFLIAQNPAAIKFISTLIRLVGTRNMLFRTHFRTQDFMKDVVVLLSNTADQIKLPSKEDALNLLHFLLAFVPNPNPVCSSELRFSFYQPRMHRYYAPAIDSLAKMMLVDEPNRTYFKSIFADPSLSHLPASVEVDESTPLAIHQQYGLLTRAFALAIAVLPDRSISHIRDESLILLREATLSQGLLAADVLCGLLPASGEAGGALARSWLGSRDSWVSSVVNMCRRVFNSPEIRLKEPFPSIVNRALAILRGLATRGLGVEGKIGKQPSSQALIDAVGMSSDDEGGDGGKATEESLESVKWDGIDTDVLPNKSFVIGALVMHNMDARVLRNLVALATVAE